MKKNLHSFRTCAMIVMMVLTITGLFDVQANTPAPKKGNITLKSISTITFNKDGILFFADPLGGHIYAIETKGTLQGKPESIHLTNIDEKIGAVLGVSARDTKIEDMAIHPVSREIYLAVTRKGNPAQSVLVKIDHQGKLQPLNLTDVSYYETAVTDIPAAGTTLPLKWHTLSMAITDMAFVDGELFVAGLSGEAFSSKLRRFAFPFNNETQAIGMEIFHTSHDRYETNAPIETFLPFPINGQMHILAGYGCSPVAKFSLQDIRSAKKQLRGVTLAELGGGNRPLDMVAYNKDGKDYVLISNSDRTLMRMSSEDLDKGQPMTTVVSGGYVDAGVGYLSIAEVGVMQLDDYDDKRFIVVQRNIGDGSLELKTLEKWF